MSTPPRESAPRTGATRHVVARTDELPPGSRRIVELDGRQIGVFNIDGEYVAFLHRCPHMGGPLCHGEVIGLVESDGPGDVRLDEGRKFLTCPLHGWEFDVHTGRSYFDPTRMRAKRFPVEVRSGADVGAAATDVAGPGDATPAGEPAPVDDAPGGRVPGPYTAETFSVSVEQDYIVVSTGRPARS